MTQQDEAVLIPKLAKVLHNHHEKKNSSSLCKRTTHRWLEDSLSLMFPILSTDELDSIEAIQLQLFTLRTKLSELLACVDKDIQREVSDQKLATLFFVKLEHILKTLETDAQFIFEQDPAAKSLQEVMLCYPGFFAIAVHRLSHFFYQSGRIVFARVLSEFAHTRTGIDIHPGANIGSPFSIDHGTGIVIGETSIIGKNVKLFQGVTLGAKSVKNEMKNQKRHPTVEDNCIIYSNASILGGGVTIGKDSIIGGNVWLTESVPAGSKVFFEGKNWGIK